MKKYDVVILSERRYVNPTEVNDYISNVLLEDDLVKKALEKAGLKVLRLSWDDPDFNWSDTEYILFRTTWDYFDRFNEFSTWLEKVSQQTKLINSEAIIRWNLDKHYLLDLQKNGVHVCESYFIEKGETSTLQDLAKKHNLSSFVLKPCVSGGGRHTYKINQETISEHESLFKRLISENAYIIQPFQHNIVEKGEISLMIMNGEFTHAVLKIAKPGDFRVQDDFGGTVHNYTPTSEEILFAEKAVNACPEKPMYARVDIFTDNNNKLAIAELELIEPELWFRNYPEAANKLSNGIKKLILN
ncbi:ATP-grasp domain-containing protein [Tenacibaculum sp. MEBiC06402]|uniref:ATP-grasp domain-containing protein n=1 Tax=unclassified Tenacibaculum TaxID=2635139 RepID=UPI003B9B2C38